MAVHIYQLGINYNVGGQFASNILHYTFDDSSYGDTATAAARLCLSFQAANQTPLKTMLSQHVTILSYKARAVNVVGGFEGGVINAAGVVGLRTGNLMASGAGPVIIWYPTANAKPRGRTFLPGVSDTDCIDGVLTAAYKAVLATQIAFLLTPIVLTGGATPTASLALLRRGPPLTFLAIGEAQTSDMVGMTRRRQVPA
jgi:hypothetical protein